MEKKMIIGSAAIVGFINFIAEDGKRALLSTGTYGEGPDKKPNGVIGDINSVTLFLEPGISLEKSKKIRVFSDLIIGEYEGKPSLSMTIRSEKQVSESTEPTGLTLSGFVNYVKDNRILLGTGGYTAKDGTRVNFDSVTVFWKNIQPPVKGNRMVFRTHLLRETYNEKYTLTGFLNSDRQIVDTNVKEKRNASQTNEELVDAPVEKEAEVVKDDI